MPEKVAVAPTGTRAELAYLAKLGGTLTGHSSTIGEGRIVERGRICDHEMMKRWSSNSRCASSHARRARSNS